MRKTFSLPVAATAAGGGVTPPPADTVDNIEHSVRFNSADSAYLSRTPSSAGNQKTFTLSFWYKRSTLNTNQGIISTDSASFTVKTNTDLLQIQVLAGGYNIVWQTGAVFRDPSAWYHVVVSVDTTQSTAADAVTLYVNNVEQTLTATTYSGSYTANVDTGFNGTGAQSIGRGYTGAAFYYSDHYLANIHNVDGQALTPSSFGFTDSNGVWQPKAYTGSYGTNGFHLDFADTSSATALGNDVSGNNNDFTPSGLVAGPAYTANSFSTEFDGTDDYLSIPDSTDLDLGSGDFTIEAWIYSDSANTLGTIIGKRTSYGQYSAFILRNTSTTGLQLLMSNTAGNAFTVNQTASSVITSNTWHHIAVTRNGSAIKAYVDGTEVISSTFSTAVYQNTEPVVIGSAVDNHHWNGKISNLRIIKGRALYTSAFTPPSTALTATDDTVLLTCQDATVRDNSNIGHSVTASGDVAVVNEGPFNGYSGSFDGSGDYLSVPDNNDLDLGTGDFTIELWVNPASLPSNAGLVGKRDSFSFGSNSWRIAYTSANNVTFLHSDDVTPASYEISAPSLNTWTHYAFSRESGTLRMFKNGTQEKSVSFTYNLDNTFALQIGANTSTATWNGKISNLRIVKGQALYTSAFTPPTADLTTTSQGATASNVKLLTCQDSTFIDNSPSAHTITVNGDAHTVSVNPHTDKYSVTFDGIGDRLTVPSNTDFALGTGDFTIEFWAKPTAAWGAGDTVLASGTVNQTDTWLMMVATNKLLFRSNGQTDIEQASASLSGWNHIAAVRSGSTVNLYLNGTSVGSGTYANSISANAITIGSQPGGSGEYTGYLSNLRITKGQALYTSNFLPSKEDLTTTSQGATASNVKLLTCQSYKIQDNSPSAHTITPVNDAKPSTDAPFVTSGAGSFDGTGDMLSLASTDDFNFGTNPFTIEFWLRPTANQVGLAGVAAQGIDSGASWFVQYDGSGSKLRLTDWGTNYLITTNSPPLNTWTHYAYVREGTGTNESKLYVNGVLDVSGTISGTFGQTSQLFIGGGYLTGGRPKFQGNISNFRISNGLARYTANFTPPTEDFDPTDQDTTFLALQGNTLDDLAGDHAVSALGNAATSTVSPFEPVDGSDAMLDSPTNYGSGDTVRGNYPTFNPLAKHPSVVLTNGNLDAVSVGVYTALTTIGFPSTGKYYAEFKIHSTIAGYPFVGIGGFNDAGLSAYSNPNTGAFYAQGGYITGSVSVSSLTVLSAGDIVGVAYDAATREVWFSLNGTYVSSGNPATGANPLATLGANASGLAYGSTTNSSASTSPQVSFNGGQQPFKYPAPSGYKSLCSTNLPTGTVTTSGSFTGTGTANGPFIYLNGVPTAMTINSNSVTFGTDADKLSNGFKVRSSSASYNSTGTNTYSITTTGDTFNRSRAQTNP